jgi:hypothetical protein
MDMELTISFSNMELFSTSIPSRKHTHSMNWIVGDRPNQWLISPRVLIMHENCLGHLVLIDMMVDIYQIKCLLNTLGSRMHDS